MRYTYPPYSLDLAKVLVMRSNSLGRMAGVEVRNARGLIRHLRS